MQSVDASDRTDPRIFYWTYGLAACAGGLALIGWGPLWFGAHLPNQLWGKAALVRVFGAFIVTAGCFAASLGATADPIARRRIHPWFLAANGALFVVVITQQEAIWNADPARSAALILFAVVILGIAAAVEDHRLAGPVYKDMITLFGGKVAQPALHELRSRYEEQIREASAQEERNRLARDLHDSIKQQVFAIQTSAATAQVRFDADPAGAKAALDQVRSSAREAMTEMEAMLDQLRAAPLENVGLVEALKKQCEALAFRLGAQVDFRPGALPPSDTLPPGAHQAILRVAQEALANVGRHSRAKTVHVTLGSTDRQVELKIADDGVGFAPNDTHAGMGLMNMRQRAAQLGGYLLASSRPGEGTTIRLSLPCVGGSAASARRHLVIAAGQALVLLAFVAVAIGSRQPSDLVLPLCFLPLLVGQTHLYLRARKRGKAS